jgi:hypothetical protein
MSGRIEYKYLVSNELLPRIRSEILPHVLPDLPPGDGASSEYTVRSVYFDTPRFDCYEEKSDGLKMRNKFRVRGYGRDGTKSNVVFLEIKRKCDSFIQKHRASLAPEDLAAFFESRDIDRFIGASGRPREKEDALRFLYHYGRHGLRPTALVVYDREAFKGRFDSSLRVTFDKNVRGVTFPELSSLFDDEGLRSAMPGNFILEVKFFRYALPEWVRSLIARHELPRLALSKYAMCLETAGTDPTRWMLQRRMHAVRSSA